ncbi:MAG: ATP-binding cassette domain-containing protein, partial [Burkholderiales bacterium]
VISRLGSQTGQQKVIQEAGEAEALQSAIATAFAMGSLAIVLYVAAPSAHASGASLGATVAMILLALASSTALREFAALRTNWDKLLHMLLPVDDVQASKPTENSKSNFTVNANLPEGTVLRASGLTFGYSRTRAPLISDIGLELRLGEQLGLTGPSGGGKSTLAGLLAGDHQPWSGSLEVSPVLLDKNSSATAECATDTPAEQLAVRRNFVAWVDKSAFFFEGTVRENLCLWEADIPEERLQSAISDACLDDVIAARPGGLDAKVTERGGNFSGGQRQRLEIARALLREPTLLILDEATDALDPALEARVRENIRRRGCTLVMVSHRASTLAACDRVLRVVGGVISTEAIAASTANDATAVTAARADQAAESNSAPAGPPVIDTEVEHSIDLDAMGPALRFIANFLHARPIGNPNDNVTSPARNIASLAKTYGLHVRNERFLVPTWWRRSTDTVLAFRKNTRAPVVMMASNGGHRIVDPATSQDLQLGYEDLEIDAYRFYRRIDDDAQPTEAMLLRAARQHLAALLGAAAISTVLAVSLLLLPLVALRVFDPTGLFVVPGTASLALGLCALVAAVALLDYCHCIAPLRSGGMLELSFNAALVQRLPRLAPAFCVRTTPQSMGRALIAMQRLFARLRGEFLRRVANTATIVTSIALLTWIDASIAAIATLVALGAIVLPWLLTKQGISQEPAYEAQNLASRRFLIDVLNGIFRLRLLDSSTGALQRWIGKHSSDVILEKYVRSIECWRALLNNCYPLVGIYVVAVAGANFAATGPWLLPAVLLLAWALLEASLGVGAAMVSARRCAPWLEEANLLATAPIEPDSTVATGEPQRIELRDIAYRYAGTSVPALANISLNINRGEFIAITGPSGGGKSTLLRMLLGLDDPQAGAMLHNGAPITPAQRVAWRHGMGMVSQDERAHSAMTIRGQIAGSSPYGVKAVWEAVQTALLADDIHRMPMGLQTIVETGKISTGQEQRLLIARELLRQPSVLILDEATNAIPDSLQAELFANLRKIGLTCVLVTHRETAIEHMDRVLVLEGGRIEWSGTPAQLRNEERLVGMLRAERQEGHL